MWYYDEDLIKALPMHMAIASSGGGKSAAGRTGGSDMGKGKGRKGKGQAQGRSQGRKNRDDAAQSGRAGRHDGGAVAAAGDAEEDDGRGDDSRKVGGVGIWVVGKKEEIGSARGILSCADPSFEPDFISSDSQWMIRPRKNAAGGGEIVKLIVEPELDAVEQKPLTSHIRRTMVELEREKKVSRLQWYICMFHAPDAVCLAVPQHTRPTRRDAR